MLEGSAIATEIADSSFFRETTFEGENFYSFPLISCDVLNRGPVRAGGTTQEIPSFLEVRHVDNHKQSNEQPTT